MGMNLRQLIDCIDKFSPRALALADDHIGVQVGPLDREVQGRTRIRKCAVSVDATPHVILKAASSGSNILVTYHNLLLDPVVEITGELYDKVRLLVQNRMSLYAVHTSWLSAECGLNDTLADILDLAVAEPLIYGEEDREIPIGRICSFEPHHEERSRKDMEIALLSSFIARIAERLRSNDIVYVGSLQTPVRKVALTASNCPRTDLLRVAKSRGADTYLTGSICREAAVLSDELGLNYVCANQHIMETLGMRRLMQLLSIDAPEVEFAFIESKCPWNTYVYPNSLDGKGHLTRKT